MKNKNVQSACAHQLARSLAMLGCSLNTCCDRRTRLSHILILYIIIPGKIKEEWNASKAKSEKSQLADRRLKPLDSSSSNSNVTQKNIKSQEKVSLPENSLDKYVESLSPMQKASVKKTLSVELKDDNGHVVTRAKWVEDKISQDGNADNFVINRDV